MSFHRSNSMMRAAFLMCSALLTAQMGSPQSVQTAPIEPAPSVQRVLSLDPSSAYASANRPIVKGEASFANAPANFYAFASARAGETARVEGVKLRFDAPTTLTKIESTADFTIEDGGSCVEGQSYAKGDTCIVLVRFTPQGAGRRLGKLTVAHAGPAEPAAFGLGGYGYEPVVSFTPAVITTVPGTYPSSKGLLSGAKDLVVDGGDILYIDDIGNNLLREIDSTGAITNVSPFFGTPASIAVDNFGDVWAPTVSGGSFYFSNYNPSRTQSGWSAPPYTPGSCTASTPCNLINVGLGNPAEISIDSNNNLLMEEETRGALEMPVSGWVDISSTLNLWYLDDVYAYYLGPPSTFAANANDDLFTAISYTFQNDCSIVEEPLYGAEGTTPNYTRVAGGINCGYSGDGGQGAGAEIGGAIGQIAFDVAGDLYFTDTNNQWVRMINATTGIISTIAGNGTAGYSGDNGTGTNAKLSYPTGVAVDSQGQVYIISGTGTTSGGAQVVRKLGVNGDVLFGSRQVGTPSAGHTITLTNTGNSTMTLTGTMFTGNYPGDFSVDPTTTTCVLTPGATLYAGQSCKIGFIFKPHATGTRAASFVMLNNTVTNSNTVLLSGTGTSSAVKLNPGAISFPATAKSYTTTVPV
ncbi:MAG TPA: choice-of-anchor D domain-containing protein, partial [Acidobacteriaceae bacterium]